MLPEKRKNLIITIIVIVVLVIVFIALAALSNFIKRRNEPVKERENDSYSELYEYVGISLDDEGVYKIFGINDDTEQYLNVRTFFPVIDSRINNKKLVFYSDATNELRYDKSTKEFYLYELDSYYNKNTKVLLASNYIVFIDSVNISYQEIGTYIKKDLADNNILKNALVYDNILYYLNNDGIYRFDLTGNTAQQIMETDGGEYDLLYINQTYVVYGRDSQIYVKYLNNSESILLKNMLNSISDITFIDINSDNLIYMEDNVIKKYNIRNTEQLDYEYEFNYTINKVRNIKNNLYFMNLEDEDGNITSVIVDLNNKNIVKTFENYYEFVGDLNEN